MKKLSVIFLILMVVLGACSKPASSTSNVAMGPFERYPETVVIRVGRESNPGGSFAPGTNSTDNAWTKMLYDVLNIKIEVAFEVPGGEYDEELMRRAASGTLPDTFGISETARGQQLFNQLLDAGLLADLTPAYQQSIGGRSRQYLNDINLNELLQYVTVNGKIYAVNGGREGYNTAVMWIRKDWLDACGLGVPTTIAELENVAQEFVRRRPGGQANTIGIAFNPDPTGGIFGQWFGLLPVFNALGSYPDIWVRDSAGNAVNGAVQPQTRQALETLARWTQLGIFSREMFTMKNGDEVRDTYVATNACGIYFNAWWDPWPSWNGFGGASVMFNQGTEWIPVMAPLNAQGRFSPKEESNVPGGQVVLASFAHPEAIVKAINLLNDVETHRNPEFANLYDTYIRPTIGVTDGRTNGPFRYSQLIAPSERMVAVEVINNYISTGTLNLDPRAEGVKDWIEGAYKFNREGGLRGWWALTRAEREDDANKATWEQVYVGHYGFNLVSNLYVNNGRTGLFREQVRSYVGNMTDAEQQYGQMTYDYTVTTFLQIMAGERPASFFDEYVTQWNRMGGSDITSQVNTLFAKR
jgi:putative aldouronate transport system substrate-binding protein